MSKRNDKSFAKPQPQMVQNDQKLTQQSAMQAQDYSESDSGNHSKALINSTSPISDSLAEESTKQIDCTRSSKSTVLFWAIAVCAIVLFSFIIWYFNNGVYKAAKRFEEIYAYDLNAIPPIVIYHFDGKWLVSNWRDKPRTLLQYDPIDVEPQWVKDGLATIEQNPDTTQKQALFAAYYKKHVSTWEESRKDACAVLGKALFENTSNYNEDELDRIQMCFILYATDMMAM